MSIAATLDRTVEDEVNVNSSHCDRFLAHEDG